MTLRVIGAGVGRTGTASLKAALERLMGGPCYHMMEVLGKPEHIPVWRQAAAGDDVDWEALFDGYVAAVDWPTAAFWRPLASASPDALVLLSTRDSAETWWKSANGTIFEINRRPMPGMEDFGRMWQEIAARTFTERYLEREPAIAAYEAHNAAVRAEIPASRLVEWQPGDGWEPLCAALGVPVPDEPFPHANSTEDFRAMARLDEPAGS
jgi:hypothetical protein